MQTIHPQTFGEPIYVLPRVAKKQRSSLFASVLLGLVFNCSLVSVVGVKLGYFPSIVGNIISAGAMITLIVFTLFRAKRFEFAGLPSTLKMSLAVLILTVFVLGAVGFTSPMVQENLRTLVLLKSGGTILSILALVLSVRVFSHKEISKGLILFSVIELAGCVYLYAVNADINPNAISVRAVVAGLCLFALLKTKFLKITAVGGCLAFSMMLGCRTSSVAMVGAMTFLFIEKRSRRNRGLIMALVGGGIILLLLFLGVLLNLLEQVGLRFLGSDNFVADFFLHDKSSAKIRYDYLDRYDIWEYSWSYIRQRPLFGYGIGTEQEILEARSHSAYLSMMFEGGITLLAAWLYFYIPCFTNLFNRKWVTHVGDSRLYFLAMLLLGYMLLAGLVETSGLASVSTPINLIFIFLIIWLFQPNPQIE